MLHENSVNECNHLLSDRSQTHTQKHILCDSISMNFLKGQILPVVTESHQWFPGLGKYARKKYKRKYKLMKICCILIGAVYVFAKTNDLDIKCCFLLLIFLKVVCNLNNSF